MAVLNNSFISVFATQYNGLIHAARQCGSTVKTPKRSAAIKSSPG